MIPDALSSQMPRGGKRKDAGRKPETGHVRRHRVNVHLDDDEVGRLDRARRGTETRPDALRRLALPPEGSKARGDVIDRLVEGEGKEGEKA